MVPQYVINQKSKEYTTATTYYIYPEESNDCHDTNKPIPKTITNTEKTIIAINFYPAIELNEAYILIELKNSVKIYPYIGIALKKQLKKINKDLEEDCVVVKKIDHSKIFASYISSYNKIESFDFIIDVDIYGNLTIDKVYK